MTVATANTFYVACLLVDLGETRTNFFNPVADRPFFESVFLGMPLLSKGAQFGAKLREPLWWVWRYGWLRKGYKGGVKKSFVVIPIDSWLEPGNASDFLYVSAFTKYGFVNKVVPSSLSFPCEAANLMI